MQTPRYLDPRSARHITNKRAKHISLISDPPPPRPLALGETPDPSYIPPRTDPFLATSNDPSRFVPFLPEVSTAERLATLEHETGQDYRSIAGMVKASDLTEEGDEAEDDLFGGLGIIGGESQDDYLKRRNLEFDRALRDEPTNVQLWKDFVDFQDEVATTSFIGTATKRALSKSERTSTSEIKLSILDRALAVERNKGSEELLLAYLRAAAEVWDPKKVLERWAETLRSHPTLTGLWIEYVSWRQTSWVNFGVREVVEVFEESFRVLSTAAEKEQFGSQGECKGRRWAHVLIVSGSFCRSRATRGQRYLPLPSSLPHAPAGWYVGAARSPCATAAPTDARLPQASPNEPSPPSRPSLSSTSFAPTKMLSRSRPSRREAGAIESSAISKRSGTRRSLEWARPMLSAGRILRPRRSR